ncbi:Penicillinase repressor [Poriferisphaera corsica]|uniref:Penicillinase repressor n=1 Tax=Poriferisphaera corsica TaxID=2528020 RepID=A0A517YQZ7_9BACT|nr:BlaI/MecI/CopY family transcriptional regulator [Poriferisphaera corsica]QDU32644.1 Penicillinase repressor [Poriferisphaera corsica]
MPPVPHPKDLSRRERQIMDILFSLESATVNDIQSRLPDPPSHTAVRTFLKILQQKGHINRTKSGREFVYKPKHRKSAAGLDALRNVLSTFYSGSLEDALSAHLTDKQTKLTDTELKNLNKLIRAARNKDN